MSLSREFGAFVAGLKYEDLPAEVVDRAKGVTLQALSSALVARDMPASRQALALMQEEEAGGGGAATVLCHGAKAHQGRRRFRQRRDDLRRRQVGHLPHADPSRHRDIAGGAGRSRMDRASTARPSSPASRPDTRSWSGWRPSSSRPSCRAAFMPGRCSAFSARRWRRRRSRASTPARCTTPSRNASTSPSGNLEGIRSGGRSLREGGAVGTRCWRWRWRGTARRAARPCWKARPASTIPMPATTAANCATASPATTAPTWRRSPPGSGATGCSSKRCTGSIRRPDTTSRMST